MFTGFNVKLPEYEVVTPQTHLSFTVRTLTVSEEEHMKASLVTPIKVTEHLNRCIWNSIVSKPENITDYNSFLKSVTMKDREALLYGLYHITYGEVRNYFVICSQSECKNKYPVTVSVSSTFNFNPYPDKDILTKTCRVELPVTKGVYVSVKQPTLFDEITSMRDLSSGEFNSDMVSSTLVVQSFEQDSSLSKNPVSYTDRKDIIEAYRSLPAKDRKVIHSTYYEQFGQYGMSLKMKSVCPKCSSTEVVDIELVEQFFRMVFSV